MSDAGNDPGRRAVLEAIPAVLRRMREAGVSTLDARAGSARLSLRIAHPSEGNVAPPAFTEADPNEGLHAVVSPLTGVAYLAPGPDQPPYVQVGEVIAAGQVVALVEAMKVFNEIRADRGGRVVRLGFTPGQVVPAGTPLVYLEPDDRPERDEA